VSLCHFHHRRLHDGAFRICSDPETGFAFEAGDGRPILRRPAPVDPALRRTAGLRALLAHEATARIDADTARTRDATVQLDMGYVVSVVADGVERARGGVRPADSL
jgi:hypothetical protein